ncbi:MAG: PepSY domain-containing protein [Pelagimonas sp.]|jgi:uncharacterized iron-regulated membrane protein|nr:PepSY domain-containing protein [Pelagimonas sp.]
MTDVTTSAPSRAHVTGGAFYRLVWKWHFLASLFVLPFMILLSITGGIYLYHNQIDERIYAQRLNVPVGETRLSYEQQIDAVKAAVGITRLRMVSIDDQPGRATRIEFNDAENVRSIAWVDPYAGAVLGVTPRDRLLMRMVKKFHGELLLGKTGTKFVELAAHWAIVMFITGLYLWWPRGQRGLRDAVSLPKGQGRAWWRETHLFTGFLAAILVLPILITGLPWTDVWGGGLSFVQKQTGQKSHSLRFGGRMPTSSTDTGTAIVIGDVFAIAKAEGLKAPYEVKPPRQADGAFWVRSAHVKRKEQTELVVDQYSGKVIKRIAFANNPVVSKAVSYGISFHEGKLYGPLNLIQNTLAAVLGVVLSVTGFVAWWKRRPAGSLGVPNAPDAALHPAMMVLIVALAMFLPLMGASLVVAIILDWLLFRRLGWFRATS